MASVATLTPDHFPDGHDLTLNHFHIYGTVFARRRNLSRERHSAQLGRDEGNHCLRCSSVLGRVPVAGDRLREFMSTCGTP